MAALIGDSLFQAGRRLLLNTYVSRDETSPVYNYLFTGYTPDTTASLGVLHASEIPFGEYMSIVHSFSRQTKEIYLDDLDLVVYGTYAASDSTNAIGRTSSFMLDAWIAFANTLNPNRPNRKFLHPLALITCFPSLVLLSKYA